jgi:thymidylate synthase
MKQYLDLLRIIRETGRYKQDRTGTGTYSIFGHQMRFDLSDGFPLVTTKKTHLKSIIHELLWFLKGETNIRYLKENGVSIWDEWIKEGTEEWQDLTISELHTGIKKRFKADRLAGIEHADQPVDISFEMLGPESNPAVLFLVTEDFYNRCKKEAFDNHETEPQAQAYAYKHIAEFYGIETKKLIAGELGPVYGSQWRSWPNPQMVKLGENLSIYERCVEANQHDDYFELLGKAYVKPSGPERNEALKNLSETFDRLGVPKERRVAKVINPAIDQIANLINQLKNNPDSRRLIVSAWNPAEVDQMALPPCHCLFQFYTAPLSFEERQELAKKKGFVVGEDPQGGIVNATLVLNELGVPERRLYCQLYQRKSNCALIA